MSSKNCIFCKVINGDIPSKKIKENDSVIVIEDIAPKAPIHYLIIPKKHVENIHVLQQEDFQMSHAMLLMARDLAKDIAKKQNLEQPLPFNLLSNNGEKAGQSVLHMHWHFISGKDIYLNGLEL